MGIGTKHPTTPPSSAPATAPTETVLPVISEVAEVHKLREHTGTVRIRKRAFTEDTPVSALAYDEVVETRRVPVGRVVERAEPPVERGDLLIIPVYQERLVKQLVLAEEIHVHKRRVPRRAEGTVSLRREELVVERFDSASRQWVAEPSPPGTPPDSSPTSTKEEP